MRELALRASEPLALAEKAFYELSTSCGTRPEEKPFDLPEGHERHMAL